MGGCRRGNCRAEVRLGAVVPLLWLAALALTAGCTPARDDGAIQGGGALSGELHVLVAASLLPVAETLADEFRRAHPHVDVLIVGAGSSALREQVLAGAPADVFIPADPAHLDAVSDEIGLSGEPVVVARNSLVLAVPAGNEADVGSLTDLGRPELLIGLCAAEVPCGDLARAGLAEAGIEPRPDTDEPNVRALVTKLSAGELDAAVVYASDTHRSGETASPEAPRPADAITSLGWNSGTAPQALYAAAALAGAPNGAAAEQFVAFLRSDPARTAFLRYGFGAP